MRNKGKFGIPEINRRDFLRIGGAGLTGYAVSQFPGTFKTLRADDVTPLNTARMCIFVMLYGGPSHMDTFDLKVGDWTPADFDEVTYNNINLSRKLFPNLATPEMTQQLAVVRSVSNWSAVHAVAEYWEFVNQEFNPAFVRERPHVGAVVAMEYNNRRRAEDALPGFVALNGMPGTGAPVNRTVDNGFLSALYAPFPVTAAPGGVGGLTNPLGPDQARFDKAWQLLQDLDRPNRATDSPPMGKPQSDYNDFYNASKKMMYNPTVDAAFKFSTEDRDRFGNNAFGNACIVSRNLSIADAGTAFVFISFGGWDNHANIYNPNVLPKNCQMLDLGLANLMNDLAAAPGRNPGQSALDETLIVLLGDFGRTPPDVYTTGTGLNQQGGRDHYPQAQFAAFAGGGVQGGRVIGATNETGRTIIDRGWSGSGPTRPEDINDTIYSALGIDWTKTIANTPSGRVYRYSPQGPYGPINELFQP